jgi:hypothetical protein
MHIGYNGKSVFLFFVFYLAGSFVCEALIATEWVESHTTLMA